MLAGSEAGDLVDTSSKQFNNYLPKQHGAVMVTRDVFNKKADWDLVIRIGGPSC